MSKGKLTRQKFVYVIAKQLSERIIPKQSTTDHMSMAGIILRENLKDLGIRYGDTGFKWGKAEATDMADYELECGQ